MHGGFMKIAVITGASGGLGAAFVRAVSRRNEADEIWMIARRKEIMEKLARDTGTPCRIITADLCSRSDLQMIASLLARHEPVISLFISNAGIAEKKTFEEETVDELLHLCDLNVAAPAALMRICLPYLAGGSRVIQTASFTAFAPFYDLPFYAAGKTCLLRFGEAMHARLKERGITVLTICPGNMETEMNSRSAQKQKGSNNRFIPYLSVDRVAEGALKAAAKGRSVWTPGISYRFFRVLMCLPHRFLLRFVRA